MPVDIWVFIEKNLFLVIVCVVILASAREWYLIAARKKAPLVNEAPFVESRIETVGAEA